MEENRTLHLPVLFGPTASGKSALAMEIAERSSRSIEVISADSRQVYRHLDIGTAKPSADEQRRLPHHLLDVITPDQTWSAGRWAAAARSIIADLLAERTLPLVVGGAGFYIRALFDGFAAPPADPATVAALSGRLEREGAEALFAELLAIDPDAAALYDPHNGERTVRALACWIDTGLVYSRWRGIGRGFVVDGSPVIPKIFVLDPERPELYDRIGRRTVEMVERGLVAETEGVIAMGYAPDSPGLRTVGYAQAVAHLAGEIDSEEMTAAIQQATRRYAKRQVTWMRGQMPERERIGRDDGERVERWMVEEWRA